MSSYIDGITGISDATALAASSTTTSGGDALGKEAFLSLLTTQMQNQDPLDPVKNEDFVAQLASFSSLEQLMGLGNSMSAMNMGIASLNNASMAGLVGTDVVAMSDNIHYSGEGDQDLYFDLDDDVVEATITIQNADGETVWSDDLGQLEAGEGSYTWDGKDLSGQPLPEGDYTFTVSGKDISGESVGATELIKGTITEMDYTSGTPSPSIEGTVVGLGDLLKLTVEDEETE